MIDPVLSAGAKSGYTFASVGNTTVGGALQGFETNGTPATVGTTGTRAFCSDQSGVIRYNTSGTASARLPVPAQPLQRLCSTRSGVMGEEGELPPLFF